MQVEIRTHSTNGVMDQKDAKKFLGLHEEKKLLRPEQPGGVMAGLAADEKLKEDGLNGKFLRSVVLSDVQVRNGKTNRIYSWDDKLLAKYRD